MGFIFCNVKKDSDFVLKIIMKTLLELVKKCNI